MTPRRLLLLFPALILSFAASALPVRAEDEMAQDEGVTPAPKPSKKKTSAKRKAYDYDRSKYKSREPSQTPTYKFNEKGEPISAEKKKSATKKKRRSEPPEACGSEDSCAEKKAEADAL